MSNLYVRVKNKKQFEAACQAGGFDVLIADYASAPARIGDVKAAHPHTAFYLQLPDVLRENKTASVKEMAQKALSYDGMVIKNLDELGLLLQMAKSQPLPEHYVVVGDAFLYAYNSAALSFYKNLFPQMRFIAADELTDVELASLITDSTKKGLANASDFLYKAYGYQPLMITNQCLNRNYYGCLKPQLAFTDEKKNRFPVTSECGQCYDIVYNGQPTVMLDNAVRTADGFRIDRHLFANILLDFTLESAEEVTRILAAAAKCLPLPSDFFKYYTRGHHYSAVE